MWAGACQFFLQQDQEKDAMTEAYDVQLLAMARALHQSDDVRVCEAHSNSNSG